MEFVDRMPVEAIFSDTEDGMEKWAEIIGNIQKFGLI